jgi:hypothetical protein
LLFYKPCVCFRQSSGDIRLVFRWRQTIALLW